MLELNQHPFDDIPYPDQEAIQKGAKERKAIEQLAENNTLADIRLKQQEKSEVFNEKFNALAEAFPCFKTLNDLEKRAILSAPVYHKETGEPVADYPPLTAISTQEEINQYIKENSLQQDDITQLERELNKAKTKQKPFNDFRVEQNSIFEPLKNELQAIGYERLKPYLEEWKKTFPELIQWSAAEILRDKYDPANKLNNYHNRVYDRGVKMTEEVAKDMKNWFNPAMVPYLSRGKYGADSSVTILSQDQPNFSYLKLIDLQPIGLSAETTIQVQKMRIMSKLLLACFPESIEDIKIDDYTKAETILPLMVTLINRDAWSTSADKQPRRTGSFKNRSVVMTHGSGILKQYAINASDHFAYRELNPAIGKSWEAKMPMTLLSSIGYFDDWNEIKIQNDWDKLCNDEYIINGMAIGAKEFDLPIILVLQTDTKSGHKEIVELVSIHEVRQCKNAEEIVAKIKSAWPKIEATLHTANPLNNKVSTSS